MSKRKKKVDQKAQRIEAIREKLCLIYAGAIGDYFDWWAGDPDFMGFANNGLDVFGRFVGAVRNLWPELKEEPWISPRHLDKFDNLQPLAQFIYEREQKVRE